MSRPIILISKRFAGSRRFCCARNGTIIFVTHDRVFLEKLATRIVELDRGRLYDWACDYPTFLKRRDELFSAEAKQQELFDKRLAQEEAWIRKGIEARRTRNEGRVRALKAMREERRRRRERQGVARIQAQEAERSGTLVIEAKNVSFGYGDRRVVAGAFDDDSPRRQGGCDRRQCRRENDLDPAVARRVFRRKKGQSATVRGWKLRTSTS